MLTNNDTIKALEELLEVMLYEGDLQRSATISKALDLVNRQEAEVEVRHGKWIEETALTENCWGYYKERVYRCSLCGRIEEEKEPYCHCGAKMDGGNKNG